MPHPPRIGGETVQPLQTEPSQPARRGRLGSDQVLGGRPAGQQDRLRKTVTVLLQPMLLPRHAHARQHQLRPVRRHRRCDCGFLPTALCEEARRASEGNTRPTDREQRVEWRHAGRLATDMMYSPTVARGFVKERFQPIEVGGPVRTSGRMTGKTGHQQRHHAVCMDDVGLAEPSGWERPLPMQRQTVHVVVGHHGAAAGAYQFADRRDQFARGEAVDPGVEDRQARWLHATPSKQCQDAIIVPAPNFRARVMAAARRCAASAASSSTRRTAVVRAA